MTEPTQSQTRARGIFERYLAALNNRDLDTLTALVLPVRCNRHTACGRDARDRRERQRIRH
jgi:hypothetical protein